MSWTEKSVLNLSNCSAILLRVLSRLFSEYTLGLSQRLSLRLSLLSSLLLFPVILGLTRMRARGVTTKPYARFILCAAETTSKGWSRTLIILWRSLFLLLLQQFWRDLSFILLWCDAFKATLLFYLRLKGKRIDLSLGQKGRAICVSDEVCLRLHVKVD